ncbi:MAG: hypothetical protein JO097_08595 [Acidobacteriaceae bacterium]|nr:hypothetical protein [Acidobacteriaceae bacterium]MBV9293989.1 hypothetical protein [Acidobacteriaceae bacterium]
MRCSHVALAVLAAPFLPFLVLPANAGAPNFSGTWQLDAAKSQADQGQAITLTIQNPSGKLNFERIVRDKDGKELKSQFSCEIGGNQCDFEENGHKAKVSLWFNGPALQILKTDGPKEDAVTQWSLQLSADGNTLTVEFDHIDPTDKKQTLVFDKKGT